MTEHYDQIGNDLRKGDRVMIDADVVDMLGGLVKVQIAGGPAITLNSRALRLVARASTVKDEKLTEQLAKVCLKPGGFDCNQLD